MKHAAAVGLFVLVSGLVAFSAVAAPYDFRGFHAGAHAGYARVDGDFAGGGSLNKGGSFGGLQAGYDFVTRQGLLYGVESDVSLLAADPQGRCPYNAALSCDIDAIATATARARAGYARDDFLFYVTGGLAAGRFSVESRNGAGTKIDDFERGELGWTVGAGVEYMIGDIVGVKLEYRYLNFNGFAFSPGGGDIDFNAHTVMGGINFHF